MQQSFKGIKFKIVHCFGALESFHDALGRVHAHKRKSLERSIIHQIIRLADGYKMSRENFPQEGELPRGNGDAESKKFKALKKQPLRAYCWLSDRHENTYFISHYVYKDYQKLKSSDTKKVGAIGLE